MKKTKSGRRTHANPPATDTGGVIERGWYLYGITRRLPLAALLAESPDWGLFGDAGAPPGDTSPLQLLEYAGVVAVVRQVPARDFDTAIVQEQVKSASDLEKLVRGHHRIIEAIHAHQPIMPAKFGMIYTHARDIVSALRFTRDSVAQQLDRLDGCDEWAVHLYADRSVIRERISKADVGMRRLQQESAGASPGRAYFLERQLRDALDAATRDALVTFGQKNFDRISGCAVAGQVNSAAPAGIQAGEVEILSASFLVKRDGTDRFIDEVQSVANPTDGLRCEYSGPWPPYSFAALDEKAP